MYIYIISKDTINNLNDNTWNVRKNFKLYTDKGFLSRIYKEHYDSTVKSKK